jgi:AcrR family transcriptional regulator
MTQGTKRRAALAEAATDHVLEHGLLGLSLRPLAAALGTSDRMLLYHFADKDDLVATVLRVANDRSVREVEGLPDGTDVEAAVHLLWGALTTPPL